MNRREFVGSLTGGAALLVMSGGAMLTLEGCNVWTDIKTWVPIGISAFESIVSLVTPLAAPGIDAIAQLVEAGFASLAGAVDDYINAPASQKTTFAEKVKLILTDIGNNIQGFLSAIGESNNPIVKVVAELISVILNTIAGFASDIPGLGATAFRPTFHVGARTIQVTAVKETRKSFIKTFNAACLANGHPELVVPHTTPLK